MRKIAGGLVAVLLLFGWFLRCDFAHATEQTDKNDSYIQISPTKQRFEMEAGGRYVGQFYVQNAGNREIEFKLEAVDYQPSRDEYGDDFQLESTRKQLSDWVSFETEKTKLLVGESATVNYVIEVPEDAPAGGQYAVLAATTSGGNSNGIVTINSQVGMVLYANIKGETRTEGKILENNLQNLFLGQPVSGSFVAENTGNVDFEVEVETNVYNFISNKKVFSNEEKPYSFVILPESKRKTTVVWSETPQFGVFKVVQKVRGLGEENVVEKIVWVSPVWLFFILLGLVGVGITFVVFKILETIQKRKVWS